MKKLYFTIEKEISSDNETLTGNKNITVYEIINNEPKQLCSIDCDVTRVSTDAIQEYLDDNGMGDDQFEFILL